MKGQVKTNGHTHTHTHRTASLRAVQPTCQSACSCCKILMATDVALRYCQTCSHTHAHTPTVPSYLQPLINTSNTLLSLCPSPVLPLGVFLFVFSPSLPCPLCLSFFSCFLCFTQAEKLQTKETRRLGATVAE